MEKLETAPIYQTMRASLENSFPGPSVTFPDFFHFSPVCAWFLTFSLMSCFGSSPALVDRSQYLVLLALMFDAIDVDSVFLFWTWAGESYSSFGLLAFPANSKLYSQKHKVLD